MAMVKNWKMSKLDDVENVKSMSILERGLLGLPVTDEEIAEEYDVPEGVVGTFSKDKPERKSRAKYNSKKHLDERTREIDDVLISKALKGDMRAIELHTKLTDRLTDRVDVKVGLSKEDFVRQQIEAQRELIGRNYRIRSADGENLGNEQSERPLLPDGTCVDTESEHGSKS